MKRIVSYILFIFCMWACANTPPSELPFFNSDELEPEWISPSDSKFTRIHKVKPFSFLNQDSVNITNKDLDGFIYVIFITSYKVPFASDYTLISRISL